MNDQPTNERDLCLKVGHVQSYKPGSFKNKGSVTPTQVESHHVTSASHSMKDGYTLFLLRKTLTSR